MRRSNGAYAIGAFAAGVGIGLVLSLLWAPQSGEETRELIAEKAKRSKDLVNEAVDQIKSQVGVSVKDAKSKLHEAVQAGKEAYQDELAHQRHNA